MRVNPFSMTENNFPLEKILNCTPTEYCTQVEKKLSDYKLVGVHKTIEYSSQEMIIDAFRKSVPSNAEVVVNYKSHYAVSESYFIFHFGCKIRAAEGIALVPKK